MGLANPGSGVSWGGGPWEWRTPGVASRHPLHHSFTAHFPPPPHDIFGRRRPKLTGAADTMTSAQDSIMYPLA